MRLKQSLDVDTYPQGEVAANFDGFVRVFEIVVPFLSDFRMYLYVPSLGNSTHHNMRLAAIGEFNAYGNDR